MQIADCDGFNTPRRGFCAPVCEAIYHANVTKDMQNAKFLFDFWFYLAQKNRALGAVPLIINPCVYYSLLLANISVKKQSR